MTIVAISREMGSGGYEVGAAVAKALNFEYVDRQILLEAAHAHGVPEAKLVEVVERRLSLWERFETERRHYLTFLEAAYYAFAERGNLVTASRSGPFFVRDVRHALKVRIMAPVDVRVRRVMAQERLDQKAAAAKVKAYDREMSGRIDYLFGLDWTRPENYDLVINTQDDAWQFYIDLLVAAARHPRYRPTPESLQRIRDLSLAAQVRAALATNTATRYTNLEVTAQEGHVALKGVVFSSAVIESATAVAERVQGVTSVSCQATEIPQVFPGPIM
ncbi:MAG TPA: cytidylate kinase family protein [Candidatus Methylomirabilis sp.]|nr:cytidylate kinase family protein [Candidatus Methylomirabilis sp.]